MRECSHHHLSLRLSSGSKQHTFVDHTTSAQNHRPTITDHQAPLKIWLGDCQPSTPDKQCSPNVNPHKKENSTSCTWRRQHPHILMSPFAFITCPKGGGSMRLIALLSLKGDVFSTQNLADEAFFPPLCTFP